MVACGGNTTAESPASASEKAPEAAKAPDTAKGDKVTLKFQQWWGVELPEGYLDDTMHDLDTNIALTKAVVDAAHAKDVFVEGEIGHVGLTADTDNQKEDLYTKPDAAAKFCRDSGVDSLAVSIGNAHGAYKETPHLDIRRLEEIRSSTDVPLVLHGGSGIPDDQLLEAFSKGSCKFNLGTDYLNRYFTAVQEFVEENKNNPDPVKIINMPAYVQKKLQPYVEDRLRTLCHF